MNDSKNIADKAGMTIFHRTYPNTYPITDELIGQSVQCHSQPGGVHDDLKFLYNYWREKCADGLGIVRLRNLDLMDFWRFASRMIILDLSHDIPGQKTYRYRYVGTELCELLGHDLTGMCIEDIYEADGVPATNQAYDQAIETGIPSMWQRRMRFETGSFRYLLYDRLIVPLRNENGDIGHLLGVFHLEWRYENQAQQDLAAE